MARHQMFSCDAFLNMMRFDSTPHHRLQESSIDFTMPQLGNKADVCPVARKSAVPNVAFTLLGGRRLWPAQSPSEGPIVSRHIMPIFFSPAHARPNVLRFMYCIDHCTCRLLHSTRCIAAIERNITRETFFFFIRTFLPKLLGN